MCVFRLISPTNWAHLGCSVCTKATGAARWTEANRGELCRHFMRFDAESQTPNTYTFCHYMPTCTCLSLSYEANSFLQRAGFSYYAQQTQQTMWNCLQFSYSCEAFMYLSVDGFSDCHAEHEGHQEIQKFSKTKVGVVWLSLMWRGY